MAKTGYLVSGRIERKTGYTHINYGLDVLIGSDKRRNFDTPAVKDHDRLPLRKFISEPVE